MGVSASREGNLCRRDEALSAQAGQLSALQAPASSIPADTPQYISQPAAVWAAGRKTKGGASEFSDKKKKELQPWDGLRVRRVSDPNVPSTSKAIAEIGVTPPFQRQGCG